jgi:hypothetical protein
MKRSRFSRLRRSLGLLSLLAVISGTATYAFTADLFVPATSAGDGNETINKPSVASMYFTYDSSRPDKVSSFTVTFGSSVGSAKVRAQVSGSWSNNCSGSGAGPWNCSWSSMPDFPTSSNASVRVVVAQ